MEFILVTAKITILLSGIMFTGVIVERSILYKYEANLYASGLPLSCSAFFLELSVLLTRTRRTVILFQSELTPEGPVHTVLAKISLRTLPKKI